MIPDSFPILEFDPTTRAILEPIPVNLSEPAQRRAARQAEGCLVVEMEATAFLR